MKKGTHNHPKVWTTCKILGIRRPALLGHLELLWDFTSQYAPRGDIGRYPDERIEAAMDWSGKRGKLLDGLVQGGWIERHPYYRLITHDWHEHCNEGVRKFIARHKMSFVAESESYKESVEQLSGQCLPTLDSVPDIVGPRARAQPLAPCPLPRPQPSSGDVHTPNSPPPPRGPLARPLQKLLKVPDADPSPAGDGVRHTRTALSEELGAVPDEEIVTRIFQAAREEDAEISDTEIGLLVHAVMPDSDSSSKPRGPAWFESVIPAHIRERHRDVTLLRAFVRGEMPMSQVDGLLVDARADPRLLKALRVWRFQATCA